MEVAIDGARLTEDRKEQDGFPCESAQCCRLKNLMCFFVQVTDIDKLSFLGKVMPTAQYLRTSMLDGRAEPIITLLYQNSSLQARTHERF